jgi:hypothetical protein
VDGSGPAGRVPADGPTTPVTPVARRNRPTLQRSVRPARSRRGRGTRLRGPPISAGRAPLGGIRVEPGSRRRARGRTSLTAIRGARGRSDGQCDLLKHALLDEVRVGLPSASSLVVPLRDQVEDVGESGEVCRVVGAADTEDDTGGRHPATVGRPARKPAIGPPVASYVAAGGSLTCRFSSDPAGLVADHGAGRGFGRGRWGNGAPRLPRISPRCARS